MSGLNHLSDTELVDLCNTGDRSDAVEAYETLYARHKDYVLRVAFRYVGDADLALDVLQDTFSYILKKFPPPGEGLVLKAQLQTLLYVVARNNAISILRKTNKGEAGGEIDPDDLPAPAYRDSSDLATLLRGLTPGQKEIVTLRFIDDLPLRDIGEILNIPLGTVKSRLHKAIDALRKAPGVIAFFEK